MYAERAFVLCVHFLLAAHGDARTGSICMDGLHSTVQIQCLSGEWIHVKEEVYGNGDKSTCRLKTAESCSKRYTSSQNGLIVICNGKQSCREVIPTTPKTNCNYTDAAAEVQYNCIKGSMDLCSTGANRTTVHGSLYLHSPGFPNSVGVNGSCVVRITGQNIQVTLVEERMKKGLLNISGDGKQLSTSVNVDQYNRALTETAAEVVIVYDNHDQNESNVWIRVDASGQMGITSKGQMSDASATSVTPSTQQPSRSPGTSSHSTSDTPTTATTASTPTTIDQSTTTVTAEPATEETTTSTTTSDTDQSTTTVTAEPTTEETSTSTTTPDTGLIVLVPSAASGCIITIVIVAIAVVLCRRKDVKTSRSYDPPDNGSFESPFELSSMNIEKEPYGSGQNESRNVSGSREPISHTESTHKTGNYERPVQDQYSTVLPRSSRVNTYDNSKFTAPSLMSTTDNDHNDMTENVLYDGGFASRDDTSIEEGMVDNRLYDKFEYDREKGSVHGELDTSPSIRKQTIKENCDMIENDVYNGGPPLPADPVGSKDDNYNPGKRSMSTEISHMIEHDLYDGGLDTGDDNGGGMVDNELYYKFGLDRERDSIQDETNASPSNVFDKSVQDDEDSVMVSNGLYHSFK